METMKWILGWIRRELFFDLNRVYKDDYRKPPRNRHERRLQAKEDRCWHWNFFYGRPIYKWHDYIGAYESLLNEKIKDWINKHRKE